MMSTQEQQHQDQQFQRDRCIGEVNLRPPPRTTCRLEETLFNAKDILGFERVVTALERKKKSPNTSELSQKGQHENCGDNTDQNGFVTGYRLACLMAGLMLAQFLVSIDRTIISTVSLGDMRSILPLMY